MWILIVVALSGNPSGTQVTMTEFNTEVTCNAAARLTIDMVKAGNVKARCVKK